MKRNANLAIARRLLEVCRTLFNDSPSEFARALEISYENLRQYLVGKSKPGNKMQARFRNLGIDPEWIMYGTGRPPFASRFDDDTPTAGDQFLEDRSYRVRNSVPTCAADFQDAVDQYQPWAQTEFSTIDHIFIRLNESMVRSMQPVVQTGDLVLIVKRTNIKDGDLVAAYWGEGDGEVRIFRSVDNKVQLWSINPVITPITLPKKAVLMYKVVLIKKND